MTKTYKEIVSAIDELETDKFMNDDLNQEYTHFKIVADMKCKQANTESEKNNILYRLELIRKRFEEYSQQGIPLLEARELETKRFHRLATLTSAITIPI